MNGGFFQRTALAITRQARVPLTARCGECGLAKKCRSPKMAVAGEGRKGVLVVGEAPGAEEDALGRPFVGRTGQDLRRALRRLDVDLDRDCWATNAAICRPPRNALPDKAVAHCRPNVVRAIRELRPEKIVLLGGAALESVVGWLWKEDVGGIFRWAGFRVPSLQLNAWVCPTFHPSFLAREENPVLERMFAAHLEAALAPAGRPWAEVPAFEKRVRAIMSPAEAAAEVRRYGPDRPVAFDYETDRLKPDAQDARIVCCSVSDGERTVAYPWHGPAAEATKELLRGPAPKVGSNVKFEHRWSLARLGVAVKNWAWDTMLAAHAIDNRQGITSVKFQAFVLLGQPAWDERVRPYLESKKPGGNEINRVAEVDLPALLQYCGMDSLMEWLVAQRQMEIVGVKP